MFLSLFKESLPSLLTGLAVTLKLAIFSIIIACVIGVIIGLLGISKNKILRGISTVYTYLIRGTPLIVQGLFLYFGLGALFAMRFDPIKAGILVLSLNAGAYLSEIFRGGILAVDNGQMEAARSLGLNYPKAMVLIVLPQAFKIMIPSILNQFIITVKDTSILSVIGIRELTQSGQIIIARNYKTFELYAMVALMYLILITVLSLISKLVEKKLSYGIKA
ncbi:polar amino acid transport system permease protein/polar amino acid transport system substrate-binding protein [Clostridium uliginosum]|uniref:Polar amino acid transport system permease protein/polar amino acid transport system substrate-binding protein n=2 Tax=Clostridium uliginosum TaxID=119641 RepID=A0A1I1HFK2_9CLOT|nr:amino acid ABC transporter permease [Clostridium uliginosum]SFC22495.1 polar amino acid transport system permease protein/polar amino acid transport system substrate-binding protein [Clostridium uliginosum]